MKFKKRYQIPIFTVLALSLSACGGGDSSTDATGVTTVWEDNDTATINMVWTDGSNEQGMNWSN